MYFVNKLYKNSMCFSKNYRSFKDIIELTKTNNQKIIKLYWIRLMAITLFILGTKP